MACSGRRCPLHRKRESQHHVTDCETVRSSAWLGHALKLRFDAAVAHSEWGLFSLRRSNPAAVTRTNERPLVKTISTSPRSVASSQEPLE
jgi:hypothetical protein